MDPLNWFTVRLVVLRREKNLTQDELASQLKVSKSVVANIENGVKLPSTDFVFSLSQKYNLSFDYLFGFSDNKRIVNCERASQSEIGKKIETKRKESKMSLSAFAKTINIDRKILSKLEKGKAKIKIKWAIPFCENYNVLPNDLFFKNGDFG